MKKQSPKIFSALAVSAFALMSLAGCDLLGLTEEGEEGEEQAIEYKSNTVLFEGINTLALQDTSGGVYSFDKDQLDTAGITIRAGQVLLIEDHSLVRATEVNETQLGIDVKTQPAVLTDAIQNGTLDFQKEVGFSTSNAPELVIDGNHRVMPKVVGNNSINYSTSINGTAVKMILTPRGNSADVTLEVAVTGKVKLIGTGSMTNFQVDHSLDIINGNTSNWQYNSSDYKIDMDISLAGAISGPTDVLLALPKSLELKIPVPVGTLPIPVHIGVGFKLLAKVDLPEAYQASSTMTTKMSYSGSQGFKYEGASLDFTGQVGPVQFGDYEFTTAALPGYQMSLTFAPVPTFGLYVFGTNVAYVDARFIVVTQLLVTPTIAPRVCKEAAVSMAITGGWTLGMFGLTLASGTHKFNDLYNETRSDGCETGGASSIRKSVETLFEHPIAP